MHIEHIVKLSQCLLVLYVLSKVTQQWALLTVLYYYYIHHGSAYPRLYWMYIRFVYHGIDTWLPQLNSNC